MGAAETHHNHFFLHCSTSCPKPCCPRWLYTVCMDQEIAIQFKSMRKGSSKRELSGCALRPARGGPGEIRGRGRARACRGWRELCWGEQIVDGDGQEGMLMKDVIESWRAGAGFIGQAWVGQNAARARRGKDIGECRFKGTAGGQLSTDRRGEGRAAWPCPTGRVGAGGATGPRSCGAPRRAEDASAREAGLIEPESL